MPTCEASTNIEVIMTTNARGRICPRISSAMLRITILVCLIYAVVGQTDIATGKTAYQISTYYNNSEHVFKEARLAVDGVSTGCNIVYTQTKSHNLAWWAVDLRKVYIIDYIEVVPRDFDDRYVGPFQVLVGLNKYSLAERFRFALCASGTTRKWYTCKPGTVGQNVVIQRESQGSLSLCEVLIRGRTTCERGRRGYNCSEVCAKGRWGHNCAFSCSDGCKTPRTCDKENGFCLCADGWSGYRCDFKCSENCIDIPTCNKSNGHCKCKPGWRPPVCQQRCYPGSYGPECARNCSAGCGSSSCDTVDGQCYDPCIPGWHGARCDRKCPEGCTRCTCDRNNDRCYCTDGVNGTKCNKSCAPGCKDNVCNQCDGSCICKSGFTGSKCNRCSPGKWGTVCNSSCSSGCIDKMGCDSVSGSCQCRDSWWGSRCENRCSGSCVKNRACDKLTGHCVCRPGHASPPCEQSVPSADEEAHAGPSTADDEQSASSGGAASELLPTALGAGTGLAFLLLIIILIIWNVVPAGRRRTQRQETSAGNGIVAVGDSVDGQSMGPMLTGNSGTPESNEVNNTGDTVIVPMSDVPCDGGEERIKPIYENIGVSVADLPDHVMAMMKNDKAFENEFKSLPSGLTAPCVVGSSKDAETKNRYRNIIAYDHSRVHIDGEDPVAQYINANFIDSYWKPKAFIAAQGPVEESVEDFIQMVWEQKVPLIIMLSNLHEIRRSQCEKYWPDMVAQENVYRDITVRKLKEETFPHYVIRHLELEKKSAKQQLYHMHYTSWPDHGVPESPAAFLDFHRKTKEYHKPEVGPSVVHCSAGVGRTGTLLAVDCLLDQAKEEDKLNIADCVKKLRKDRVNMVQSLAQYIFIHECLLEALLCGQTVYPAASYDAFETTVDKNSVKQQFSVLEKTKPVVALEELKEAKKETNMSKNRCKDVLPGERWRPLLLPDDENPESNGYINAVFVHGYKEKHAFIATQSPLPDTVVDFWRLVYDYDCGNIIALNETGDEDCPSYYGDEDFQSVLFSVHTSSETHNNGFTSRKLLLSYKGVVRKVKQYQTESWRQGTLPSPQELLLVHQETRRWQQESGGGRILVHCLDGAEQTGLFIALCHVCERIDREMEVDVFHVIQTIRNSQPLFIPTLEQYEWLHQAAHEYIRDYTDLKSDTE